MERIKRIAGIRIYDFWFDTKGFLESRSSLVALHTNDLLNREEYDFQFVAKTFLLDITPEKKDIFSRFEYKSARYAINKAIRDEEIGRAHV